MEKKKIYIPMAFVIIALIILGTVFGLKKFWKYEYSVDKQVDTLYELRDNFKKSMNPDEMEGYLKDMDKAVKGCESYDKMHKEIQNSLGEIGYLKSLYGVSENYMVELQAYKEMVNDENYVLYVSYCTLYDEYGVLEYGSFLIIFWSSIVLAILVIIGIFKAYDDCEIEAEIPITIIVPKKNAKSAEEAN